MSDTMAAILIAPFLGALLVVLECTRIGCTRFLRRARSEKIATPSHGTVSAR